jgi:DNA-binding GntR family transcriptional regulator
MRASNAAATWGTPEASAHHDDQLDSLEVREAIEGLAARLAARAARDEPARAGLEGTIAEMSSAARCNDATRYAAAHVRFHRQLLGASGNRWLRRMSWLVCDAPSHGDAGAGPAVPAPRDHELLVRAIGEGDADLAESLAAAQVRRLIHATEASTWSLEG